ncbi:MAG: RDD family protein [Melioribacteraceae bacterium]|nr:RDD family protein [Melioribacteraceae bacterium]MCF8356131.1 RDD family protein [Melioribacteraceae bacterium]MCF8395479.1 RDD family protein [Melioribacteraceae bacterium]MCF8420819.1 RDD family protein [Melioribacteraceae bacterium]
MEVRYAGFWRRFVALIIDELIIGAVQFILFFPFWIIFGFSIFALDDGDEFKKYTSTIFTGYDDEVSVAAITILVFVIVAMIIVSVIVKWLYYALMESSTKQATLGKMALGIKVTDTLGNRISFGKATGRYFGKILSGLILNIGYIMAAFTEKKQALHDILANCLVIIDEQKMS